MDSTESILGKNVFGEERAIKRTGSVEADIFVINDVILSISPEQISIQKQSFNHEWQTLRTRSSRKIKSGHSIARVSITVPFKGSDINDKLIPLIAGLRAAPFVPVHNLYLEDMLLTETTKEESGANRQNRNASTRGFKTIVLAWSSVTVTTMGHEGKPDCLQMQMDAIWFNYFPYTPMWAYKVGGTFDRPGYAWQSDIWKKFYEPFVLDSLPMDVPHQPNGVPSTDFMWREYAMAAKGDILTNQATVDLLEMMLKRPKEFVNKARLLLARGDNPTISGPLLDVLYRQAARDGLTGNEQLRQKIKDGSLSSIEGSAAGVVDPILKRVLDTSYHQDVNVAAKQLGTTEKANVENAIKLVKKRIKTLHKVTEAGYVESIPSDDKELTAIQTLEAKYGAPGSKSKVGSMTLLGRKRWFYVDPSHRAIGNTTIIEQIAVTFSNVLAIVPLAGYRYPTCQHVGSTDVDCTIVFNAVNDDAEQINSMYDSVELQSLRFRQVPAGYRNLSVFNDFLKLFGLREFITKSISTDSIPGQPGRSHIVMSLSDAGITSKTKLEDPEQLQQEFIQNHEGLFVEVWKRVNKYLKPIGPRNLKIQNPATLNLTTYDKKITDRDVAAHKLLVSGIALADKDHQAFIALAGEAADNYNEFAVKVHNEIFDSAPTEGAVYYAAIKSLQEDPEYSFVPGLDRLITGIRKRDKANNLMRGDRGKSVTGIRMMSGDLVKKRAEYAKVVERYGTNEQATRLKEEIRGIIPKRKRLLTEMGLHTYLLKQRNLLKRITDKYLDLKQFEGLEEYRKKIGLSQGLMAYPDFKQQIQAVSELLGSNVSVGTLLDIDPDVYLWYPMYAGTVQQDSIIDSYLMEQAREQSLESARVAKGAVGNFFQKTYMNLFNDDTAPAPLKKIREKAGGGRTFYDSVSWDCGTREEKLKKSLLIDPTEKTHINVPSAEFMECPNTCTHSTSMDELWGGVNAGSNPSAGTNAKDVSGKNRHGTTSGARATPWSGSSMKGIEPNYVADWDNIPNQEETAKDNITDYYCPLESYKKLFREGSVAMRDIGKSGPGFEYRRKSAQKDWVYLNKLNNRSKLQGWVNPATAEKQAASLGIVSKPISQWTYEQYMTWMVATGRATKTTGTSGKIIFKKVRKGVGYMHKGIDAACPVGTPVYAVTDGVIKRARYYNGAGLTIDLEHSKASPVGMTRYLHLQAVHPRIKTGAYVKAGQCIAVSGRSGQRKMGPPHLHFEAWSKDYVASNSRVLDPAQATTGVPWNRQKFSNIRRYQPAGKSKAKIAKNQQTQLPTDVTTTLSSPLGRAVQEFETDMLRGQAQTLMRAYPTFKLYFIEDDRGERKRLAYDDFFSYSSVKSIRVVRSRKIAADLCEIYLTNVSGVLSNRKFSQSIGSGESRDKKGQIVKETTNPMKADTLKENPIASLLLQEGMHISLRLGYSSDPAKLETVFNGIITEIQFSENEDLVRLIAQSYAVELVQDIKGLEKPGKKTSWSLLGWDAWGLADDASTARILEEVLSEPEVLHFGRWQPNEAGTSNRDLLTSKWQFVPNPADDNIFPPPREDDLELGSGLLVKSLKYIIYRTTIWDICKEMTMRHPNFIATAVPYSDKYGERMTFFFGLPNQLYFARHPSREEEKLQDKLKKVRDDALKKLETAGGMRHKIKQAEHQVAQAAVKTAGGITERLMRLKFGPRGSQTGDAAVAVAKAALYNDAKVKVLRKGYSKHMEDSGVKEKNLINRTSRDQRMQAALDAGFIRPFRRYHLLTSGQHIIANNIRANSRDVANTIVIKYGEELDISASADPGQHISIKIDEKTFTLKLDSALPTEDIRTQVGQFVNATSEELAKRYALALLLENTKEIYKGDITVIGNPSIKPYDVCYVFDEYTDMVGPIEVEEVVHEFSQEAGFRTEIKPDMLVQAAEWSLLHSAEALGIVMQGVISQYFGKGAGGHSLKYFSPFANFIGSGLSLLGGFMANKIINYTQLAQPIIMSPLMLHGRPFAGGVPTRKIPTSLWETVMGNWSPVADEGFSDWLEDAKDDMLNFLKKGTVQFPVGTLFSDR